MTEPLPFKAEFKAFCFSTCARDTVRNYLLALHKLEQYREEHPGNINSIYLTKFWEVLATTGLRRGSIQSYHTCLKQYFDFCVDHGIYEVSPLKAPVLPNTVPRVKPIFTLTEYQALKREAMLFQRSYWHDAIVVAWNTGFRISDVGTLKWSTVDLSGAAITIMPRKQVRFGKTITVPIASELKAVLERMKAEKKGPSDYVFPDMALRIISINYDRNELTRDFGEICRRAQVPFTAIHGLRRSFVSRMANAGIPPHVICSMTGHSLEEIMTYVQIDMTTKREAMNLLATIEKAA